MGLNRYPRAAPLSLALLLLSCSACSDPSSPRPGVTLERSVDRLVGARLTGDGPGYGVGIAKAGTVLLAKGYGYADVTRRRPITSDTPMNLASLSKQFTGAAVALEIAHGTLRLEDPVRRHWPRLSAFMDPIRIDQLVYMTSGLPEYDDLPSPKGDWSSEARFTVDDAINAVIDGGALEYVPGTRWTYSNTNYQILARLIEILVDDSFANYLSTSVFEPLGMHHSWVDAPIRSDPNKALSYDRGSGGQWALAPRLSPHFGGSGVFASVNDLIRWNEALHRGNQLGPQFRATMLATRRFEHGKVNDAFGLVHGELSGNAMIWYAGSDYGVSTFMAYFPEQELTIVCLANFADGQCENVARELFEIAHHAAGSPSATAP